MSKIVYNSKYLGRCPNCGSWSSVEEAEVAEVKNACPDSIQAHETSWGDFYKRQSKTKTEMENSTV